MLTAADAPVNLADVPTDTNAYQISMTWQEGAADGGTPVIDYRIYHDQGLGGSSESDWVLLV